MKKAISLLANLLMSSTLLWGVPTARGEEVILKAAADNAGYCHLKFPPIREDSLSWDRPVLNENAGNSIDFYGPCDHDPLGQDEIRAQKQVLLNGYFGDRD
jgi:hypothetical protein